MNDTSGARCISIIMDGNRRWAKEQGKQSLEGHAAGLKKVKEIVRHAFSRGIDTAILYAFSTENWNRTAEEVGYLMNLFQSAIEKEFEELIQEHIKIRFIGNLARLSEALRVVTKEIEEKSAAIDTKKTLVIALSYGGRPEIVSAVNHLLESGVQRVDEAALSEALWTAGLPDPDIVIRTGGEKRLSNFLPWQTVYSELFFTDTYWPAFTTGELDAILAEFAERERRHGK